MTGLRAICGELVSENRIDESLKSNHLRGEITRMSDMTSSLTSNVSFRGKNVERTSFFLFFSFYRIVAEKLLLMPFVSPDSVLKPLDTFDKQFYPRPTRRVSQLIYKIHYRHSTALYWKMGCATSD